VRRPGIEGSMINAREAGNNSGLIISIVASHNMCRIGCKLKPHRQKQCPQQRAM
jgi:hypothetical protein